MYQIDKEREGEQIDRALVKSVINLYIDMGKGKLDYYVNDFEEAMLQDSVCYYSRKTSTWIVEDSCPEYMLKVQMIFTAISFRELLLYSFLYWNRF